MVGGDNFETRSAVREKASVVRVVFRFYWLVRSSVRFCQVDTRQVSTFIHLKMGSCFIITRSSIRISSRSISQSSIRICRSSSRNRSCIWISSSSRSRGQSCGSSRLRIRSLSNSRSSRRNKATRLWVC